MLFGDVKEPVSSPCLDVFSYKNMLSDGLF